MFDIGWSEYALIAVVALIAIGPKELPGVLRMVGQWVGKARKMATEFQGQFREAMREAEMADLKKSFDEVKEAASGFTSGGIMTSLQNQATSALGIDEKPATSAETPSPSVEAPPEAANPAPDVVASEPLAITPANEPAPATAHVHEAETHSADTATEAARDAKAS
jgi:sec-independent protein translocase protein TatB